MGTLAYLLLFIVCAGLQHEILAASSSRARSSRSKPTAFVFMGPASPEYEQGNHILHMDNPTQVFLVSPDEKGHHTRVTGHGLAVHPYHVAVRIGNIQAGCKIASYYVNDKIQYFDIEGIIPRRDDDIVLLRTKKLILLENGHTVPGGFHKYEFDQGQYDWVKAKVSRWIARHCLFPREYRGNED